MSVNVSAPGKLVLLGEHAVVYGYSCIVSAVNRRLFLGLEVKDSDSDIFYTPQTENNLFLVTAVDYFKKKYRIGRSVIIKTKSDFSDTVGLGSSAAVVVATISAASRTFKIDLKTKDIFKLSYEVICLISKRASGADIAASTYGGTLYYGRKGKIIKRLKIDPPPLMAIYSGKKADTKNLIDNVHQKYKNERKKVTDIFKNIDRLTRRGKKAMEEGDYKKLGDIMTKNHYLLQNLGVSTPKIDSLVYAAISGGAWGAKLSGAGGGDCIVVTASQDKKKKIKKKIKEAGGQILDLNFSDKGVRAE